MKIDRNEQSQRKLLRGNAALRRLVTAAVVSSFGDGLSLVAFPLLAVTVTANPMLIAGLAVAGRIPWLLVSLPAGALVDRVDRRRLVVSVELGRAAVLGLLAVAVLTRQVPLVALYATAFLVGVGETFVSAATRGAIPLLAAAADVPGANGYIYAAETAGERFAGPAAGGVVFAWSAALPFISDAVSYLASAALLRGAMPPTRIAVAPTSLLGDVTSGLRWFRANSLLRVLAVVVSSFAFCQAMVLAVLVLYAIRTLHLSSTGYGAFLAVAAIGDVAASLLAGRVHTRLGPFWTVLAAGLTTGGCYVLLGATSNVYLAVGALTFEAAASTFGNVATLSVRHRIIPTERFGLVNNAFRMCVVGVVPLGALSGGALAVAIGVPSTFVVAGIAQIGLLLATSSSLRQLSHPVTAQPSTTPARSPTRPSG